MTSPETTPGTLTNPGTTPVVYTNDGKTLAAGKKIHVDGLDATGQLAVARGFLKFKPDPVVAASSTRSSGGGSRRRTAGETDDTAEPFAVSDTTSSGDAPRSEE